MKAKTFPSDNPLLVVVPICLLLGGCGGGLTQHGPIDREMTALIPPDTVALAGVRADRIRETPLYRKLAEENRLPRVDSHDILLATDGKSILGIARGALSSKPAGDMGVTDYKGLTLYGSNAAVRAAIERSKNGGQNAPHELMARADQLPADAQIWAIVAGWPGATPEQLRQMGNFGNLDRVLRLVEGASLTVDLRTGVHAAFTGDSRTEADAKSLADSLRGLAGLARMAVARNRPDLQSAFDALQVQQEGRVVRVKVDIAEDLAEKLAR